MLPPIIPFHLGFYIITFELNESFHIFSIFLIGLILFQIYIILHKNYIHFFHTFSPKKITPAPTQFPRPHLRVLTQRGFQHHSAPLREAHEHHAFRADPHVQLLLANGKVKGTIGPMFLSKTCSE